MVGTLEPPPPPPPGAFVGGPRWPAILLSIATVAVGLWIVASTFLLQAGVWFVADGLSALTGLPTPPVTWIALAVVNAFAVAAPAALLGLLARSFAPDLLGVRAAARTWTTVGLCGAVLGSARSVPVPHNEVLLLLTALLAAVSALAVGRIARRSGPATAAAAAGPAGQVLGQPRRWVTGFGLAAGLVALGPWLWAGALGGLTETVLAIAAAGAVGWLAASVLNAAFFAAFTRSRPWQVFVGGLAAGVALMALGAAVGGTGISLAEMFVLPALGFAAASLMGTGTARLAIAALVGTAAVGPLAFVDPEETSQLLGYSDVGFWALVASLLAVVAGLLVGLVYGLILGPRQRFRRWVPAVTAILVGLAGVGVYALAGHPGFYGERLFVIMADQADLNGLNAIGDRPARLRATYQRLVQHAERTQAPLRESLDRLGLSYQPYYLVNAVLVDGGPVVRRWLAGRSDVDRVLLDQRLRPLPEPAPVGRGSSAPPGGSPLWNVQLLGADRVWREFGVTGTGIVIGSSDSGVDGGHPALRDGFRGGNDSWYDPWNGSPVPTDHVGHGTHTLGSALGRVGIGVAPGAQWVGCVNLDRNLGSPSHYLDCLQFMLAPFPRGGDPWRDGRPERAPHILTNSWGCPTIEGCDRDSLKPATAAIRAAGIFFVAAAGNTGPRCSSIDDPPAPYVDLLTVGAVDRQRRVAEFSSRGPAGPAGAGKPDVVAPGVGVLSALPGGTYGEFDGTSMATPHVAGLVALIWSANPRLIGDIDTTARIVRETAKAAAPTRGSAGPADECGGVVNIAGAGIVDALAAVRAARTLAPAR